MNKELPKMYHNNFNKNISNNERVYSTLTKNINNIKDNKTVFPNDNLDKIPDRFTIEQKIFNIFNAKDYIYKADVVIVTDNQVLNKRIIGKNNNNLITIDNEYIPISIIRDIYRQ